MRLRPNPLTFNEVDKYDSTFIHNSIKKYPIVEETINKICLGEPV
jgi:hypothetical protein